MTREAFVEWEITREPQRYKLEYGEVVAMMPELLEYVRAKQRACTVLDEAIQAGNLLCEVISDGFIIDENVLRQPGAMIVGGARLPSNVHVSVLPTIMVEVTSPSIRRMNTHVELVEYA